MFDGIKADGKLDAMRASLTLELFKSSDCFSEFMCQLRIVDASETESVSSSRAQQSSRYQDADDLSLMSPVFLQILGLVHRLDSKSSLVSIYTEKLRADINVLEFASRSWSPPRPLRGQNGRWS